MRREERLAKRDDFAAVYAEGKTWVDRFMVLKARPNGLELSRFGFVVSKRLGKAVARNHLKRWLREGVKALSPEPGYDLIFIARPRAAQAHYQELEGAMGEVLWRAKLRREAPRP